MKFRFFSIIALCLIAFSGNVSAQKDSVASKRWNAHWIDLPGQDRDYQVCLFRKTLSLDTKPASYKVFVSGDNRYKLFVNGQLVSIGPARGDFYYWNYQTVDLAPYLVAGKNAINALVINEGSWKPAAQMSYGTGF